LRLHEGERTMNKVRFKTITGLWIETELTEFQENECPCCKERALTIPVGGIAVNSGIVFSFMSARCQVCKTIVTLVKEASV
jgi:hypothetical protein